MMRAEIRRYSLVLSRAISAVAGNIHSIHPDLCAVSVLWQEIAELLYISPHDFLRLIKKGDRLNDVVVLV
jgi:hypothetical protein